jgi:hypothetical protein
MRALIIVSLLAVAASFKFSPRVSTPTPSKTEISVAFSGEVGVLPPVGYFDPLGENCSKRLNP